MLARLSGLLVLAATLLLVQAPATARIWDTVPDEQLTALGLAREASPKELFDALSTRYRAELTRGKFARYWEPIPMDMYLAPTLFYKPPDLDIEASRDQCVTCHTSVTHGWVKSWEKSVHANLDAIRDLPADDLRVYKKEIIAEVEANLYSQGLLPQGEKLKDVQCADCHMGVGSKGGNHAKDLRMPDRAACGTCHVRQFAEQESERDTLVWPQKQWANGHPSHTVDYTANVETATWAALQSREAAAGCTLCHTNQNKCDNCHTRHEFSTVDARKPEACATCHNGVDHPEFEDYMMSKHGSKYQTLGDTWNWNARLADQIGKGGFTTPTCANCHFEYESQFTHNLVRKVRWGFLPFKNIADNLGHPWFEARKTAWVGTCSQCHSPRFAQTYLTMMDEGIKAGTNLVEETRSVVQKLYDDGLLVGQKRNRPALPAPEKDEPGGFSSLFFAEKNQSTIVDRTFAEMWEQHVANHMKALQHVNPGGWTYSRGWSDLIKDQIIINEADTTLREKAALEQRILKLEKRASGRGGPGPGKTSLHDGREYRAMAAGPASHPLQAGGAMMLLGGGLLLGGAAFSRRSRTRPDDDPGKAGQDAAGQDVADQDAAGR